MVGVIFILFACFFWAIDTLIRFPLMERGNHPLSLVFFEHLILVLFFLPRLWRSRADLGELKLTHSLCFLMIGVGGSALATVAFTKSFMFLNPSLVILFQKFQPIVAILLATLILKEPLPKPFLFWSAICLIGALMVSSSDLSKFYDLYQIHPSRLFSEGALHGYGLVLVSVVGWGASTVFGKVLTNAGYSSAGIMQGRFLLGFLAIIPFVPWNANWQLSEAWDYIRVFCMVLFSGLGAMYFYYQGLKKISAKTCAILEMFFPLFAVMVNWVFLDKHLSFIQVVGGFILVFGAFILQLKKY